MQRWTHWYWLLFIPVFGCLWVPFYNFVEPTWLALPFFYWYQLLWVPLSTVIVLIVYLMTKPKGS